MFSFLFPSRGRQGKKAYYGQEDNTLYTFGSRHHILTEDSTLMIVIDENYMAGSREGHVRLGDDVEETNGSPTYTGIETVRCAVKLPTFLLRQTLWQQHLLRYLYLK